MYHKIIPYALGYIESFFAILQRELKNLFYLVPIFYGLGILIYFSLKSEPSLYAAAVPLILALVACVYARVTDKFLLFNVLFAMLLTTSGFFAIKVKTDFLATEMLQREIGARTVTGNVEMIERMTGYTRVTIKDIRYEPALRSDKPIPRKIRVALRGRLQPADDILPGDTVTGKVVLKPPGSPIAPGSYDFRRKAYFDGMGAVGYGITPMKLAQPDQRPEGIYAMFQQNLSRARASLTNFIRASIKGEGGAIIAALVTGDRSGITKETRQAFADAGIAHILAISGLHLSIIAGFIFFLVRNGLSFIPRFALKYDTKKLAAIIALLFTFMYLLISGTTIPAQRAFIMTGVILLAVLINRVALTMRNVALAAFIVLLIAPEAIVGPSFQLSFAAVIGLVVAYEKFQPSISLLYAKAGEGRFGIVNQLGFYLGGLIFSSLIATIATAPFTIFSFNRLSLMAIAANLLAIPLVSFIIMPLILAWLFFAPFGGELIGQLLSHSIDWLIQMSYYMQAIPGAVINVPQVSSLVQGLCVIGMLMLAILNTTKVRLMGLIPISVAVVIVLNNRVPDIFIPQEQNLIAVIADDSNAYVNSLQSSRFARKSWLQLMGKDNVSHINRVKKPVNFTQESEGKYRVKSGNNELFILHQKQKNKWNRVKHNIEVKNAKGELLLSSADFKAAGGHYVWLNDSGCKTLSVRELQGERPWCF